MDILINLILGFPILIYSAILHEIAHGYVADKLGDPTARLSGRLTLNPIKHIDPFLSIILPILLLVSGSPVIFGGAKPVPVDPFNLKEGRKDIALVSLAGPATNIALAIIGAILFKLFHLLPFFGLPYLIISLILQMIVQLNLLLAIFNLLPIPPLDGSKIFALILPPREAAAFLSLGQFGMFILFFLLMFPIGGFSLETFIYTLLTYARNLLGM
jgi:Zn-dependent protease